MTPVLYAYVSATPSNAAFDSDPYAEDEYSELFDETDTYETTEVSIDELRFMRTVVSQLIVTNLLLALITGCLCAAIFSRYLRG